MADRQALSRATESTDSPTPGYLFNDIAKSCSSNPSACTDTVTYLIRRLNSKQNHNIKYKCLKVMQMVSVNPITRGQFKRALSQDVNAMASIKECLNFRGPPDAIHGDKIYEKVRVQAKETLDAIYSDDPSSEQGMGGMGSMSSMSSGTYGVGVAGGSGAGAMTGYGNAGAMAPNAYGSSGGGGMGGYGSNGSGGGNMPTPGGPKRMEGIGNPMFKDPRLDVDDKGVGQMTIGEVMSTVKDGVVGMIKDPLARNVGTSNSSMTQQRVGNMNSSKYGGYGGSSNGYSGNSGGYPTSSTASGTWNSAPPGASELAQNTGGAWTMASNRGPNAIGSDSTRDAYSRSSSTSAPAISTGVVPSGIGGSWGASSTSVASQSRSSAHGVYPSANVVSIGSTGAALSDGSYEKTLITELCPPGGMRAEPPTEKLQTFASSIPSLDPDLICPALLDALEEGQPWIIRAKALCVMETAIKVAEKHKQEGGANAYADFFYECKDEIEPLANHSRLAVREPARKVLKALGIEVGAILTPSTAAATTEVPTVTKAVQPKTTAPPPNLLDFDDAPSVPTSGPPPPPSGAPPAPPVAAPSSSGGDSLFGGMSVKSKVETAPTPAPPTPAPESDLLGGVLEQESMPATTPAPATATSDGGFFGELNVKAVNSASTTDIAGKENLLNVDDSSKETEAGSGFSFMNDDKKDTMPSTVSSKNSFDPLMGTSSSATPSNNRMQMSAEAQQQAQMMMTPQMATLLQQQQQQQLLLMQMQQMQMSNGNANANAGAANRMMMMQQAQQQTSSSNMSMPRNVPVMGGANAGAMSASFAFMDDPAKVKKDASNKKFDFVSDAMKSAR